MSHNTANTVCFVAWYMFIGCMAVFVSWWCLGLVFFSPSFRTDTEIANNPKGR